MELVVLWALFAVVGYYIGKSRGKGETGCVLGLLLGPLGWIIAAVLAPAGEHACPHCRERIHPEATICPHCGAELGRGGRSLSRGGGASATDLREASKAGAVIEVTDGTFAHEVVMSEVPVLVHFWAPGCPPCAALAPILENIAGEMGDQMKFVKVNAPQERATAAKYRIQAVPTLCIFSKGEVADSVVGFQSDQELRERLGAVVAKWGLTGSAGARRRGR